MIKAAKGNTTPKHVLRCGQMSGAYGKQIDELFTTSGLGDMLPSNRKARQHEYASDIRSFVKEFYSDALCDYVPGRQHGAFPEFENSTALPRPEVLGRKLRALSEKMDHFRHAVI